MAQCKVCKKKLSKKGSTGLCWNCYKSSKEKSDIAKTSAQKRRHYLGEDNPNYKGKTKITCPCGRVFYRRISPSQKVGGYGKYCSTDCKHKYQKTRQNITLHKGTKFRSSWEVSFSIYLSKMGHKWEYEPESFKTPFGYYKPDFYLPDKNAYYEVKGYWVTQKNRNKYEYFAKTHHCVLVDARFLTKLKFTRIKSGAKKGQYICPQ